MKRHYIPHGCDQQGRLQTGRYPRTLTEAFNDAHRAEWHDIPSRSDNHWLWWLAAAVLMCLVPAAPIIAEWVR